MCIRDRFTEMSTRSLPVWRHCSLTSGMRMKGSGSMRSRSRGRCPLYSPPSSNSAPSISCRFTRNLYAISRTFEPCASREEQCAGSRQQSMSAPRVQIPDLQEPKRCTSSRTTSSSVCLNRYNLLYYSGGAASRASRSSSSAENERRCTANASPSTASGVGCASGASPSTSSGVAGCVF